MPFSNPTSPSAPTTQGLRAKWNALAEHMSALVTHDALALIDRVAVGAVFFLSGRTKVDGWFSVNESAYTLFREEFKLPWIPSDLAANLAAGAEHLFPVLLILGLGVRLSALALLGMTLVIQVFVYPDAWPTHLSWAGLMLYLVGRGGGRFALDRVWQLR